MPNIFAIRDEHAFPAGRLRAEGMLRSGGIDVFFIEWPHPVDIEKIRASFAGLNRADAAPTLIELATIAAGLNIPIVSCDLTTAETLVRLDLQSPTYAPHDQLSAFQPWGQGVRDRNVAQTITAYMRANPAAQRGLVMFGADHFVANSDRQVEPLHKLIKTVSGFDCFLVSNTSTAVDF